jgi:ABC-type transport system involved in multi-copper enzyme maturation permease subunit
VHILRVWLHLIMREVHDQTWTVRFMVLTTTAGLLTPVLIFVGIRDFSIRQLQFDVLRQDLQVRQRTPVVGQRVEPALRVQRPPQPTTILVRGSDVLVPIAWDFGPDGTHPDVSQGGDVRMPQTGVSLDLEFLIRVVLGLLAVSLAADSLAVERQSGTLYVLLSQPLRPWQILASKLIGGVLVLALALLLIITGAVASFGVFGSQLWPTLPNGTLPCIYAVALMYLCALYALGLVIGSVSFSVASANTWSITVWIVVVLSSVPALDFAVKTFLPTPPVALVVAARVQEYDVRLHQIQLAVGDQLQQLAGSRQQWRDDEVTDAIRVKLTHTWLGLTTMVRQTVTAVDMNFRVIADRQRWWQSRMSMASPANLLFEAVSRLAGNGTSTTRRWEDAMQEHQGFLNAHLFDDPPRFSLLAPTEGGSRVIMAVERRPAMKAADLDSFIAPTETLAMRLTDAKTQIVALVCWVGVLVAAAFVAFSKTRY